jgi:hypothetical protein
MLNDFTQHDRPDSAKDRIRDPNGPPRLKASRLAKIDHQKHHRVIDDQNRQEADNEGRDELSASLQHGKRATNKRKEETTGRHREATVNLRAEASLIANRLLLFSALRVM